MKNHTKVYLTEMKYDVSDFIPCEVCGQKAVDIHHIESRGMGGTKTKDSIENLMALCRKCHVELGDIDQFKDYLKSIHSLKTNRK
jgi:hypothetical protein